MNTLAVDRQEPQRTGKRRGWRWWLMAGAVLIALGGIGAWVGLRYYPQWRQDRLVRRARVFMEWNDHNAALLATQRVLQTNSQNVAATALMGEIADLKKSPQALSWHRRLVELQPEVLENHLAFADVALALGKTAIARAALDPVASRGANSGRYQDLVGQVAFLTNDRQKAEIAFAAALKLEPDNRAYQYNQAVLRLGDPDASIAEQARGAIEKLISEPALFTRGVRSLMGDAIRRKKPEQAIAYADTLRKHPSASFDDRLQYLDLLYVFKRPKYTSFLTELQEEAVSSPDKLYSLIRWMNGNRSALLAIEWSKRIPVKAVTTMPVPVALAQSYAELGDWAGLRPLIENGAADPTAAKQAEPLGEKTDTVEGPSWSNYDYMRLALLARAEREQGQVQESKNHWNAAVRAAGTRVDVLSILARVAAVWGWDSESQELLWAVARSSTDSRWALDVLYRRYAATGATRNMLRVLTRMHEISPNDLPVQNNLASFSLLLDGNVQQGVKLADDLYQREPQSPAYASTYAFALHLQGRTAEAVKLMSSLGEETLKVPVFAAYYGILLADTEDREEARRFLILGSKAPLLPEERALVEQALAKIDRK